jgi:hypothetical protein
MKEVAKLSLAALLLLLSSPFSSRSESSEEEEEESVASQDSESDSLLNPKTKTSHLWAVKFIPVHGIKYFFRFGSKSFWASRILIH